MQNYGIQEVLDKPAWPRLDQALIHEESRPISFSESLVVRALLGDGAIGDRSFQVLRAMRRRTRDAIPRGDTWRSDAEDTSDLCYCRGDGGY